MVNYSDSGVNIDLGDDVSKILYNAAKETWKNRDKKFGELIVPFDDFSGVRAINVSNLPEGTLMNIGFDGVGTKMEIAERINDHSTIAYDLFAMVCDDAVVRGAEPVLIGSILDVNSLGKNGKNHLEQVKQLAQGYIGAAKDAGVAIVNGEVAELGNRVGGFGDFNYNWGAAIVWFAKKERLITGYDVKEGDHIIAFKENGFRSNGLSLVRKILKDTFGDNWHNENHNGKNIAKLALVPSKIYCACVVDMFGGFLGEEKVKLHAVSHITGGGLPGKLGRVLKPSKLGAELFDLYDPCDLMLFCQEKGNVKDDDAYRTWNMGNGMLIISSDSNKVIEIAKEYGINAKVVGKVIKERKVRIKNKAFFKQEEYLEFDLE